jgi:hypothetical protein
MDGIGVLMIENEDVIITTTGRDVETTSLIRIGFQEVLVVEERDSNKVGTRSKGRSNVNVERGGDEVGRRRWASGTNVLSFLILMAESGCDGRW